MFHSFMKSASIIAPAAKRAIRKLASLEFRVYAVWANTYLLAA